jgi:endoglucanase
MLRRAAVVVVAIALCACSASPKPIPLQTPAPATPSPLRALSGGLIAQGPFLFVGDEHGLMHLLYEDRPLIHGIGVYSGLNGYTKPEDLEKLAYDRGTGQVRWKGKVRGQDITFEQTASIDGHRIRLRLERTGPWPDGTWGGIQIRLPQTEYRGVTFRADGAPHVFQNEYDASHRYPSPIHKLECDPGEPRLNIVFESEDGIAIEDHRKFQSPAYVVQLNVPKGERRTTDLFLTLPTLPKKELARLRFSQIGYPSGAEKVAILEWPKHEPRPDDAVRLEKKPGTVVQHGTFGPTEAVDWFQNATASFDFTSVREPGDYRVAWSGGSTAWFPIDKSVFVDRLWQPTLDTFIPFLMCHASVDLGRDVTGHGACHMDDAARAPANFTGPDGYVSYEATGTPYEAGAHVPLSLGGWHDAGDFDLNVPAQSFVTWMLALTWEEFHPMRDVATLDVGAHAFTAAKPDGTPDLVQQIEWGALWLLSVEQPDGRVYPGVCEKQAQRSGKPLETITDGKSGNDDDRLLYVDYHADVQLNFAIGMAAASRALAKLRPELSRQSLDAAKKAFAYFQTHDEVYRGGPYTASEVKGKERDASVIAAATELYMTTSDTSYLTAIEKLAPSLAELKLDWPFPRETGTGGFRYVPPFLARLVPRLTGGPLKEAATTTCRRAAKLQADWMKVRPWPLNIWHDGPWGNSPTALARTFDTYFLSRVAPDVLPKESPLRNMLWIFGLHPTSDTVFVTGLGYPEPKYLYNIHLHALRGYEPATIPGAVIPGMGGFWYSGVATYIDEYGYYGHNEACIYTQAQYLFAVNAMRAMGF